MRDMPTQYGTGELSRINAEKRIDMLDMSNCRLCPRRCGVDRVHGKTGFCHSGASARVARAALHMWEEPCISGREGSGTVFFTGCNLRCRFCQNMEISQYQERIGDEHAMAGKGSGDGTHERCIQSGIKPAGGFIQPGTEVSARELSAIFLNLQEQGANNINLVTAGHFILPCVEALKTARRSGLVIPVVYNSSGYELADTLKLLDGLVDIYLPDFKYMDPELAGQYSDAPDYPKVAMEALSEMVRQTESRRGEGAGFDRRGMMTHGVIVRQLLLPGHVGDAKKIVEYLYRTYKDRIWISMMSQYTPMAAVGDDPLLKRRVTKREYERLVDYAITIGVVNAFIQEREVAQESFIPDFDASVMS